MVDIQLFNYITIGRSSESGLKVMETQLLHCLGKKKCRTALTLAEIIAHAFRYRDKLLRGLMA